MKNLLRKAVKALVQNDLVWRILNRTLIQVADFARSQRETRENIVYSKITESFLNTIDTHGLQIITVNYGPFQGMLYPRPKLIGRAVIPRILGCYEKELQPLVEKICSTPYTRVIDVGCAEGYYAVGLALRIRTATVFAYDLRDSAIAQCREMARANGVSERVVTGSFCDSGTLRNLPDSEKTLIISDCEGYETTLFSEDTIPFLASHDILIETHDFLDIEISTKLQARFRDTHVITTIQSCDDITKALTYTYPELQDYSLADRKILLSEERPSIMEWLFMTPRAN